MAAMLYLDDPSPENYMLVNVTMVKLREAAVDQATKNQARKKKQP